MHQSFKDRYGIMDTHIRVLAFIFVIVVLVCMLNIPTVSNSNRKNELSDCPEKYAIGSTTGYILKGNYIKYVPADPNQNEIYFDSVVYI